MDSKNYKIEFNTKSLNTPLEPTKNRTLPVSISSAENPIKNVFAKCAVRPPTQTPPALRNRAWNRLGLLGLAGRIDKLAKSVLSSTKEALFGPAAVPPKDARSIPIGESAPIYERTYYPTDCFSSTHGHNFSEYFTNTKTDRIALFCNGIMNTKYDAIETTTWMEKTVAERETAARKHLYSGFINLYMESEGLLRDSLEAGRSFCHTLTAIEKKGADAYEALLQAAQQHETKTGRRVIVDHYVHSRGGVNFAHIRDEILRRNPAYKPYIGDIYAFGSTFTFKDGPEYWAKGDPVPALNPWNLANLIKYRANIRWPALPWQPPLQAHEMSSPAYRKAFQDVIDQKLAYTQNE